MKYIIILLAIIIIGIGIWNYIGSANDPMTIRSKAQETASGVTRYYFENAMKKDTKMMESVCTGSAKDNSEAIIKTIEEGEKDLKSPFTDIEIIKAGTATTKNMDNMAILFTQNKGLIDKYLVRCEMDSKRIWYITYIMKS